MNMWYVISGSGGRCHALARVETDVFRCTCTAFKFVRNKLMRASSDAARVAGSTSWANARAQFGFLLHGPLNCHETPLEYQDARKEPGPRPAGALMGWVEGDRQQADHQSEPKRREKYPRRNATRRAAPVSESPGR